MTSIHEPRLLSSDNRATRNGHLVIVGGSKGIGLSLCKSAIDAYEHVTVLARSAPHTQHATHDCVHFEQVDILKQESLHETLRRAVASRGKIRGLAFCQRHRGKEGSWTGNIESSLTATRNTIDFLRDHFIDRGDKSIVILTSIASRAVADEQDEGYHAAKAGLLGLCRYYAFALGPVGIRVNCVAPGTLLKEESKHFFLDNRELHDLYRKITPLRRMGTAEEVSSVVQFLLSSQSSFITGQEITVDGGAGLHWQESLARMLVPITPTNS